MKKVVLSGIIGNGLEWFDYALYGAFSVIIGKLFLPNVDIHVKQISVFSIFAVGFVMRPLGAMFFGFIGDKYGRKVALSSAILMMAIPTGCIGLLPSYEMIGIWAPILLTLIRLIQGLSLGGEFSGCITYLIEHASNNKRGVIGSASFISMSGGIMCGSLVAYILSSSLSTEDFECWGWRIPFLLGMLVGLVGLYIRTRLNESPMYIEAKNNNNLSKSPLTEVFRFNSKELLLAVGIYLTVTVPYFTLTFFVSNFMVHNLHYSFKDALLVNICAMSFSMVVLYVSSILSDKFGRKLILLIAASGILIFSYPIFWLLCQHGMKSAIISQLLFGGLSALYMGPIPALLVELFPTRIRLTGVAISYNVCAAVFGGTAPMVLATMIKASEHYPSIPYYTVISVYLSVYAILSIITLRYFKDRYDKPLN